MIATPELMSDPDFVRNITLMRPTPTMSDGQERATHVTSTIKAYCEPPSPAQIKLMPEGARHDELLAVYSATQIRATPEVQDIVIIDGDYYRAVKSEKWTGSYFLAICEGYQP